MEVKTSSFFLFLFLMMMLLLYVISSTHHHLQPTTYFTHTFSTIYIKDKNIHEEKKKTETGSYTNKKLTIFCRKTILWETKLQPKGALSTCGKTQIIHQAPGLPTQSGRLPETVCTRREACLSMVDQRGMM